MATLPAWAKPISDTVEQHAETLTEHHERIKKVETIADDIDEIKQAVASVGRWIKASVPAVISAAIAAGLVNGRLGAFLNALFVGH